MIVEDIRTPPGLFLRYVKRNCFEKFANTIYPAIIDCFVDRAYSLHDFRGFEYTNKYFKYIADELKKNKDFMLEVVEILHFTAEINRD
jgi:hypothetical protein